MMMYCWTTRIGVYDQVVQDQAAGQEAAPDSTIMTGNMYVMVLVAAAVGSSGLGAWLVILPGRTGGSR